MDLFKISAQPGEAAPLAAKAARALAASIRNLAGWDRAYPASAVSCQGAWIVAGRTGLARGVAVGFPSGKRPRWTSTLGGTAKEAYGATVLVLEGSHETLTALRDALAF